MHIDELDRRFGEVERRLLRLEKTMMPDIELGRGRVRDPSRVD
jgi:hypothetical protein